MAATSQMLELGTRLPTFNLPDTIAGKLVSSETLLGSPVVVAFICNHCPYVVHIREGLAEFGRWCDESGVKMVAISSNDVATYPQDGPAEMAAEARHAGYRFPYLYDETQKVARAFRAACTPDFYVFDARGKLVYRGQFDDSRPGSGKPVTGHDVRAAVSALLGGGAPDPNQRPSIGCSLKWKSGQAPDWA
jgi:peroxiredoxin